VKNKRWMIAAVAVLLGAAGLAAAWWAGKGVRPATARASIEDLSLTVEATGKVASAVTFEIGPPSAQDFWEYNLSWMIPEGSHVKQGDVVARFDATKIDDRLRQFSADLEKTLQEREKEERNLEISLKELRLDLVKAEGELKKLAVEIAVPEDLASSVEIEQLRLRKELAERRRDFLQEKIEFEQELVRSKLQILDVKREFSEGKIAYNEEIKAKFNVKAPVSGLVVYVAKRNGDRWEVGESVWMMAKILEVADISTLRIEASILEVDSAQIAASQPAEITVDAMPGLTIHSKVDEIGRIVHARSQQDPSKVFDAYLPLESGKEEGLRPGMGVKVRIETGRHTGKITVPLIAVRASTDGPYVEVLAASGRFERRPVTLAARNATRVVVAAGLEEGEEVLLPSPAGKPS